MLLLFTGASRVSRVLSPPLPQDMVAEHERRSEARAAAVAEEHERALSEADARLRLAAQQQKQAAQLLAETAQRIGSSTLFDRRVQVKPLFGALSVSFSLFLSLSSSPPFPPLSSLTGKDGDEVESDRFFRRKGHCYPNKDRLARSVDQVVMPKSLCAGMEQQRNGGGSSSRCSALTGCCIRTLPARQAPTPWWQSAIRRAVI